MKKSKSQVGRPKKPKNEANGSKTYSYKAPYFAWLSTKKRPAKYISELIDNDPDFPEFVKKHFG